MHATRDRRRIVADSRRFSPLEIVFAVTAVGVAAYAVVVTLRADFLAHPGWLAAQKADFILGPVFVGLYWRRVRPDSRFGRLLLGFGLVGMVYVVQSSAEPALFGFGLLWEIVVYLCNLLLILTFPTGRLDGRAPRAILGAAVLLVGVPFVTAILLAPQLGPDGSISGCRALCPENALTVTSSPELAAEIYRFDRWATIVVAAATACLLIVRMLRGTPPQRRAVRIGATVALIFTVLQIAYQGLHLIDPGSGALQTVQWGLAGSRSLIWYGFLVALIAAQLFAGRALHRLVRKSLRRPTVRELQEMLREPLGDPRLELVFADAEHAAPGPGRTRTLVDRGGQPAVAILHDPQLDDDPELLQAAGAVCLLAAENADLDAAWNAALTELRESRARIVAAADNERRKLERDLHDGVQQRLVALNIRLALTGELAGDSAVRAGLAELREWLEEAVEELRVVAHGVYPPVLSEHGLTAALQHAAAHTSATIALSPHPVGQLPPAVESAVYYCCLEAIQNAAKHAGPDVMITVSLERKTGRLTFEVADDGPGFDPVGPHRGTGLQNMRDRVGALGGALSIVTGVGGGAIVSGSVPVPADGDGRPEADGAVSHRVPGQVSSP